MVHSPDNCGGTPSWLPSRRVWPLIGDDSASPSARSWPNSDLRPAGQHQRLSRRHPVHLLCPAQGGHGHGHRPGDLCGMSWAAHRQLWLGGVVFAVASEIRDLSGCPRRCGGFGGFQKFGPVSGHPPGGFFVGQQTRHRDLPGSSPRAASRPPMSQSRTGGLNFRC
jgi:hypothetical protein